ncbi:restriction endonuclease [Luteimonas terricola]|uniref:restriction endonuclease n=1 Tax=Luteimonas terricola TaxID=645597 RepID=UPI0031B9E8B7
MGRTGSDRSVAIAATWTARSLVQCKHWNAYQVLPNPGHQLLGIMVNELATRAIVVTGDGFTREATVFDAFVETGLWVPLSLQAVKTTTGKTAKHYDQIAWFQGEDFGLKPSGRAGSIDFAGAVYQELSNAQVSPRVSDHLPLWVEFTTDRSEEGMARVLGVDIDAPEPFAGVLD